MQRPRHLQQTTEHKNIPLDDLRVGLITAVNEALVS